MNTSEEQLKATYIASDIQVLVTCAEFVADIIDDDKTDDERQINSAELHIGICLEKTLVRK